MGRIHLLEDELINKIAAGEVVERPASVVKELVENAIDAGASHVRIELEEGGKKLIAITDNGAGMSADDLPMAIKRHSTSKIAHADDLFAITTMGFRGEALASIAAVSRFTLQSVPAGSREGARLTFEDGKVSESSWQGSQGTSVIVRDLFYNIPARKGFLKSTGSELGAVQELVEALILAHPAVGFTLLHNGKELHNIAAVTDRGNDEVWIGESVLRQRTEAMLGRDLGKSLLYVRHASSYGNMEALISPPGVEKGTGSYLYSFVNGRWVKDKLVRFAILRGYHSHLLKGKFPVAVVFLTVDPSLVDVNVHPAKTEMRFQYNQEVQTLIATTIKDKLREGSWAAAVTTPPYHSVPGFSSSSREMSHERSAPTRLPTMDSRDRTVTRTRVSFDGGLDLSAARTSNLEALFEPPGTTVSRPTEIRTISEITPTAEVIPWQQLQYVGAFAQCYLFFECNEQLLVVDQHAFHERILYERFCRDRSLLGRSQPLLVPEAVDLSPSEVARLAPKIPTLKSMGFDLEVMDKMVEVKAVPAVLTNRDLYKLIQDLATSAQEHVAPDLAEISHDLLATMACHAAVRAGEDLGDGELKQLLAEASTVDFYHNCPHGRRVFRWWRKGQVASWFDRT